MLWYYSGIFEDLDDTGFIVVNSSIVHHSIFFWNITNPNTFKWLKKNRHPKVLTVFARAETEPVIISTIKLITSIFLRVFIGVPPTIILFPRIV